MSVLHMIFKFLIFYASFTRSLSVCPGRNLTGNGDPSSLSIWWQVQKVPFGSEHSHSFYVTRISRAVFNLSSLILSPQFTRLRVNLTFLLYFSQCLLQSKFSSNGPRKNELLLCPCPGRLANQSWLVPEVWHTSPVLGQGWGCVLWPPVSSMKMPFVAANYC
jgi:hypothetical protein